MTNYYYIIAGLPNMVLDFKDNSSFSYRDVHDRIAENCSAKDMRLIEWLEFGMKQENLSSHTYRAIGKLKNNFLKGYYDFDRLVRNLYAARNAEILGKDPKEFIIGSIPENCEDAAKIKSILSETDILEREKKIDRLRWDKINELAVFHYFDMDIILSLLAKAAIIERWNKMDKATGSEMFRKFVDEVRDTFKGINNENQ